MTSMTSRTSMTSNRYGVFAVLGLWMAGTSSLAVPFPAAFAAADRLMASPAEAETAFLQLAENERPSRWQRLRRDAAFAKAAECAITQGAFDRAREHAEKMRGDALGHLRMLTEMRIWSAQQQTRELLEAVGMVELGTWPEALIHDAAMLRAAAALTENNRNLAEKDALIAAGHTLDPVRRARAKALLGDVSAAQGRTDEARARYREALGTPSLPDALRQTVQQSLQRLEK